MLKLKNLAKKLREVETQITDTSNTSVLQNWIIRPTKQFIIEAGLYIVTWLAVFLSPSDLYSCSFSPNKLFLRPRPFVLYSVGLYELLIGQFVYFSKVEEIQDTRLKNLVVIVSSVVGLLYLILIFTVSIHISAKRSKLTSKFPTHIMIAGYSMGAIPVIQLIDGIVNHFFRQLFLRYISNFTLVILINIFSQIITLAVGIYLLYQTWMRPLIILNPGVSYKRLRCGCALGWFSGMLILLATMVVLFLTLGSFKIGF